MKVLILSGRFGFGHEMAANAIREEFKRQNPDAEIIQKDLPTYFNPFISKIIYNIDKHTEHTWHCHCGNCLWYTVAFKNLFIILHIGISPQINLNQFGNFNKILHTQLFRSDIRFNTKTLKNGSRICF